MIKKTLIITLFSTVLLVTSNHVYPAAPAAPAGFPFNIDPQELEQMAKELDTIIDSMPPADKELFFKQLAELEEQISKMSPEELDAYFQNIFSGQELPVEAPKAPEKPQPTPAPVKKDPAPEKKVSYGTAQELKIILDTLVNHGIRFIFATELLLDFPYEMTKWTQKGAIEHWKKDVSWASFKQEIETLLQKMIRLTTKSPKTGEFHYLEPLIKEELIIKKLKALHINLSQFEPAIDIKALSKQSSAMNEITQDALQSIINAFCLALNIQSLNKDIDELFAKFEPKAKELKEQEAKLAERAYEESKRAIKSSPTIVAGSKQQPSFAPEQRSAYQPNGKTPYYEQSQPSIPQEKEPRPSDRSKETSTGISSAGPSPRTEPFAAEQPKTDPEVANLIETINNNLSTASDTIEDSIIPSLQSPSGRSRKEVAEPKPLTENQEQKTVETQPTPTEISVTIDTSAVRLASRNIKRGRDTLGRLTPKLKAESSTNKKRHRDELKAIYKQYESAFKEIITLSQKHVDKEEISKALAPLVKEIKEFKKDLDNLPS